MTTKQTKLDSFGTTKTMEQSGKKYHYASLRAFAEKSGISISKLPFSIKILLENLLRREDGIAIKKEDILALAKWDAKKEPTDEIQFTPARVLLQDFTGVPAVADLAAMRGAIKRLGGNPDRINPLSPADLVIDHSVQVDAYGSSEAKKTNSDLEFERNKERYEFLRWGQSAFKNFRVVPPGTGIIHQVNLEYIAPLAMVQPWVGGDWIYLDTVVGTDSHTTMINGLGTMGWGVGGIEAEAALLGQPCSMLIPQVIGMKLTGKLNPQVTATDLVLTVTQILRKKGVVSKFVEFFGPGLSGLTLADRATLANMAPEYGATMGLFPVDSVTLDYFRLTGRGETAALVEAYFKEQGLWHDASSTVADYTDIVELDLSTVEPCLAGPSRPQDRVPLGKTGSSFRGLLVDYKKKDLKPEHEAEAKLFVEGKTKFQQEENKKIPLELTAAPSSSLPASLFSTSKIAQPDGQKYELSHGSVVIASITSCTNTSNPSVLVAAGLLARNAIKRGLKARPWVKTSLAPGSKVVTDYLNESGLMPYLEGVGFHVVGYGCTTCIGNSGPLPDHIQNGIVASDLAVASVLSGNRNFEGRVHPNVRANYLASPPLVVAYALFGNVNRDITKDPIGTDPQGLPIYLKDIWPSSDEVAAVVTKTVTSAQFKKSYADVFLGDKDWQNIQVPTGQLYQWDQKSTYIKEPSFFTDLQIEPTPIKDIQNARCLALLGDSVTTDHISPAGSFNKSSAAGVYLTSLGVDQKDFNSYGARRGNHEVMVRGTFANVRLKNLMLDGIEGGFTKHIPTDKQMTIFDASKEYIAAKIPLIVLAGKEYGTGSSRDWAAKGPKLLGVQAVIAESFERIHRSNLVGMGIAPLQYLDGESAKSLGLTGYETFSIKGIESIGPGKTLDVTATDKNGKVTTFKAKSRVDTLNEVEYFKNGGILSYVIRQAVKG